MTLVQPSRKQNWTDGKYIDQIKSVFTGALFTSDPNNITEWLKVKDILLKIDYSDEGFNDKFTQLAESSDSSSENTAKGESEKTDHFGENYEQSLEEFKEQLVILDLIEFLQTSFIEPIKSTLSDYNLSLISGEYYINSTQEKLEQINHAVSTWNKEIDIILHQTSGEDFLAISLQEISALLKLIKDFQEYYGFFISRVRSRLDKSAKTVVNYHFEERIAGFLDKSVSLEENIHEFIFLVNIKLAIIDEGYICDEDSLSALVKIASKLRRQITGADGVLEKNMVNTILLSKVDFLIYKILLRFTKDDTREYLISNDTHDLYSYSLEDFDFAFRDPAQPFHNFYKSATGHYNVNKTVSIAEIGELEQEIEKHMGGVTRGFLEVMPVHKLSKYCRRVLKATLSIQDLQARISFLDTLIDRLEKEKNFSKPDKLNFFAYETHYNLLLNCRFRLFSFQQLYEVADLNSLCSNWKKVKDEYLAVNPKFQLDIFPFYFYRSFSAVIILFLTKTHEILNSGKKEEIVSIEENISNVSLLVNGMLTDYHQTTEKFGASLLQNKQAQLMPVYMTMNECLFNYEHTEENISETGERKELTQTIGVFLDSSYILPSNYDFLKNEKEKENFSFNKFYFLCIDRIHSIQEKKIERIISEESKKFEAEVGKREAAFDVKVKDNQLNAIQLIGLYAGMITFVLGSVSIIPKFERSYTAILLFLYVFASCLSIFIALLRLMFQKVEDVKADSRRYMYFLIFCAIIFVISIIFLYAYKDQNERGHQKTTEIKSSYYFSKTRDGKRDSLLMIQADTSTSQFNFNLDANKLQDTTKQK